MDLEQIESLLKLLAEHDVSEFSFKDENQQLKLRLGPQMVAAQAMAAPMMAAPTAAPAAAADAAGGASAEDLEGVVLVEAPMVGTFYRRPAPDKPPYVEVGARVTRGQTLCIVEAMKLMNEIEAEISGTVVAVLAEDAQAVQFGQDLFQIRAD